MFLIGSYHCRMGWSCSDDIVESPRASTGSSLPKFGNAHMSSAPGGIIYKNVMAKTRREKGKESELQVSANKIS